jgi:integrase/recombinase XerD
VRSLDSPAGTVFSDLTLEHFSPGLAGLRHSLVCGTARPDQAAYVGFPFNRWDRNWPSLTGFQPGREVPDDHCRPIHRARYDPARLHRSRTAALAGFLAGYRGLTREAYALDLRHFTTWCRSRSLPRFAVRRADIGGFAWELEVRGRARATVTRRLCTIARFYRYAVKEELLEHSPAAHLRRPRLDYESHAVALDRNELGALLVAAGLGPPLEHALISLPALNGLRVSEASGADIERLGLERGHRTLTITRKGDNVVTIPLAPGTARAVDLAPSANAPAGRSSWPEKGLDRHGAGRIVRKTARRARITKTVTPHTLCHAFITAAQMSGVASGASFDESGKRARPAVQRAALEQARSHGSRCTLPDLECHHPLASNRTMMQPVRLRRIGA